MIATLTSKGQVTVPKKVRDELRLHAGDQLDFITRDDGHIEVIPRRADMRELKGMLPRPRRTLSLEEMERAIAEGAAGE